MSRSAKERRSLELKIILSSTNIHIIHETKPGTASDNQDTDIPDTKRITSLIVHKIHANPFEMSPLLTTDHVTLALLPRSVLVCSHCASSPQSDNAHVQNSGQRKRASLISPVPVHGSASK